MGLKHTADRMDKDKNKNRTDLLAAGRKRVGSLLQLRTYFDISRVFITYWQLLEVFVLFGCLDHLVLQMNLGSLKLGFLLIDKPSNPEGLSQ